MRFRLSIVGLLFAWLCASGGLLDVTQVFAWAKMYAGYAQTMPLREAVGRTFDPAKPCALCMAVLKARQAAAEAHETPAVASVEIEKILLIAHRDEQVVVAPVLEAWPAETRRYAQVKIYPVPVPPPRGGVGVFVSQSCFVG